MQRRRENDHEVRDRSDAAIRNANSHLKVEEARNDSPLDPWSPPPLPPVLVLCILQLSIEIPHSPEGLSRLRSERAFLLFSF